jgi:hypothetical protein
MLARLMATDHAFSKLDRAQQVHSDSLYKSPDYAFTGRKKVSCEA